MSLHSSEAFILDVRDLQEYDQIVSMLTRDHGRRRGVANGARRKFSRFAGQLQLLAKVRASWYEKEGRELARISALETIRSSAPLTEDLESILLTSYLAEHVRVFAQESEVEDHLFRLLDSVTQAIADGIDADLATRYLEVWVLRLAGLFPAPEACPQCGADLTARGATLGRENDALYCKRCAPDGMQVAPETLGFLIASARRNLRSLARRPPSGSVLRACEEIAGRVRRTFLQNELKSYTVMRETLARLPKT